MAGDPPVRGCRSGAPPARTRGEFAQAPDASALWRLEVCLRADGTAPRPIPVPGSADEVRTGLEWLGRAQRAYPRLRDVPGDPHSLDLLLPTEVVADLVAHGAQALSAAGIPLLLPRAWNISEPSLRLRVEGAAVAAAESTVGLDGLVGYRWELALGDTVLSHDDMRRLISAQSDLVRLRGEWVQADHTVLAAAAKFVALHHGDNPITLSDLIGQISENRAGGVPLTEVTASGWPAALFDPARPVDPVTVPGRLKAQLRPYQERGLAWLATMNRLGCGAVLADDMGLGKTVQVLALLLHEREQGTAPGPTVLVCPMSVVGNWQREAERFAPDLRVLVHHGAGRAQGRDLDAAVAGADLVVTTYALLARDIADLSGQQWERVVLDEAQHIKNAATRQARAARALPARHRLALTGTPVENRLEELRSIFDFAVPKLLGSPQTFRARFAVPIERENDENAVARLRTVTAPFLLRRVKTDPAVISDLPDKLEMTVRANLTAEQAALYQAVVEDMLEKLRDAKGMARKGAVLGALTRLKQVCNHPAHFLGDSSAVLRRGAHRSGKLALVEDVLDAVLAEGRRRCCSPSSGNSVNSSRPTSPNGSVARSRSCTAGSPRNDATVWSPRSRRRGAADHAALAQGRRNRAEPDSRQSCGAPGPLVESGGGEPGHRPRFPDRAATRGTGAQTGVRRHDRGTDRRDDHREERTRRSGGRDR